MEDEFGNTVTGSTASVTVALSADPTGGEATLSGTLTVDAVSGVAAFGDLSLDLPGDGFTLEATASGLPAVTSDPFAVHLTFAQVSAGDLHSCGVTVAGHPYCWGKNANGQLGDGTTTARSSPVPVDVSGLATQTFTAVSGGEGFTCGVTTADEAFCWWNNSSGRLGDGTTTDRHLPEEVDVSALSTQTFALVRAGVSHTCGVTTADEAFCWGNNFRGKLGDNTTTDRHVPEEVDVSALSTQTFARVSPGGNHTCGVTTADEAFCWGNNFRGQLGDNTTTDRHVPEEVDVSGLPTGTFAQVSAAEDGAHTCGVTTTDEAFCWGGNGDGQLGDGTTTERHEPVAVEVSGLPTGTFAQVSAGEAHTCGVTTADEAFCWGFNGSGQLGDGTTTDRHLPEEVDVSALSTQTFAQVSAGEAHTCGMTTAGEAFCWGSNSQGQLGDGTGSDSSVPVRVVQ